MAIKKSGTKSPVKKTKAPSDAAAQKATLADHEKRITTLEDRQTQLGALHEDMRSHMSFLAEKIIAIPDEIERRLDPRFRRLEEDTAILKQAVRHLADEQLTLATKMDRVEDRLTGLEGRTSGVETAIRESARGQDEHARRLEKLERAES